MLALLAVDRSNKGRRQRFSKSSLPQRKHNGRLNSTRSNYALLVRPAGLVSIVYHFLCFAILHIYFIWYFGSLLVLWFPHVHTFLSDTGTPSSRRHHCHHCATRGNKKAVNCQFLYCLPYASISNHLLVGEITTNPIQGQLRINTTCQRCYHQKSTIFPQQKMVTNLPDN